MSGHAMFSPPPALSRPGPGARSPTCAKTCWSFLALALLIVFREPHMSSENQSLATFGAELFVLARLPYALVYVWGVPWVRSIVFGIGLTGLALMAWALL